MAFTVKDFQSLLRLLERQPEWRDRLLTVLLGKEFPVLPRLVRELARAQRAVQRELQAVAEAQARLGEAQARTEEQVRELLQAQARTDEQVRELAQGQARTEEQVRELAEAQARTEAQVRELVQAQAQIEERVRELTDAQARAEERVGRLEEVVARLVEAQARIEERLGRLEEAVARLTEAQARTEEQVRQLAEAQAYAAQRLTRLEETVARLAEAQARTEETVRLLLVTVDGLRRDVEGLKRDVGKLIGHDLERTYRERAHAYFQEVLNGIRVVDSQELSALLDEAVQAGRITVEERFDVMHADVVVSGRREGEDVYLVAEVSVTVDAADVERARRRAQVLEKAVGRRTIAAVAGESLSGDPDTQREARTVWRVLDGRADPPEA